MRRRLEEEKDNILEKLKSKDAGFLLHKKEDTLKERVYSHHDYCLQEMRWMAADFAQERKWKQSIAKKQARAILSYHKNLETKALRNAKIFEANRKRTAAKIGRDVKKFWGKIDKIVAYKLKLEAEEQHKKAMAKHLESLVEQTEKFSNALACTLAANSQIVNNSINALTAQDINTHNKIESQSSIEDFRTVRETKLDSALKEGDDENYNDIDGDDYTPESSETDDELTIAAEECVDIKSNEEELNELALDNEMSLDELRAKYQLEELDFERDKIEDDEGNKYSQHLVGNEIEGLDLDDDDYTPENSGTDDEMTIAMEECLDVNANEEELNELESDNKLSIVELRAKYQEQIMNAERDKTESPNITDINTDNDTNSGLQRNTSLLGLPNFEVKDSRKRLEFKESLSRDIELSDANLSFSKKDEKGNNEELQCDDSKTPSLQVNRPFLLSKGLILREYQTIGLNWLVTMYKSRLNGILADEMGLGKTIQTIALLSHLACNCGIWGPHLIVVPTSCIINWEIEFKRFCPAFKVLTYYGNARKRKELREGWTRLNAFHICITSYQLVVQDAHCFRRKKWYFLILDEAHNIKNWKSQRWQTLLNFNSHRRLLLTGTPLQNNLMELWALMHFLMPSVFRSRKEFSYWFSDPLNSMVEGEKQVNGNLVNRLHGVIRPFLLRRLKKDVEKQLPGKFYHTLMCSLSRRQRFLYEDFISRSSTRKAMSGGNFLSMMNILMQLRKVCNHPDLFEPRPIISSFDFQQIVYEVPSLIMHIYDDCLPYLPCLNLLFMELYGLETTGYDSIQKLYIRQDVMLAKSKTNKRFQLTTKTPQDVIKYIHALEEKHSKENAAVYKRNSNLHELRCNSRPLYGTNVIQLMKIPQRDAIEFPSRRDNPRDFFKITDALKCIIQTPENRIASFFSIIKHVVSVVPRCKARSVLLSTSRYSQPLKLHNLRQREVLKRAFSPFFSAYYESHKRTQIFFPDKRLIQFDCGKLQQLDGLLRKLKSGGHRCLIFTQMSSMLDILEKFLSLHGHTYFRLDGATKVERRQRLMDRFNSDQKIFAFILSTRSGGLGINLTGADTVIFYDSDWNPAMDAQAQDRAHRIGQTRDVHIYRLVSEFTVEENILKKAEQKRQLDFLVMSEGNFTTDFFSKTNLRELVGSVALPDREENENDEDNEKEIQHDLKSEQNELDLVRKDISIADIENAMAQLEDEDDNAAMQGVKKEVLDEQLEFEDGNRQEDEESEIEGDDYGDIEEGQSEDEAEIDDSDDANDDGTELRDEARLRASSREMATHELPLEKKREKELDAEQECELLAWKESLPLGLLEERLSPVERYALHFRENIEPLWVSLPSHADSLSISPVDLDIGNIAARSALEEQQHLLEGEVVAAEVDETQCYEKIYQKEKALLLRERKRRKLTGEAWKIRVDDVTKNNYYLNEDTWEATWDKPHLLILREQHETMQQLGYQGLILDILLSVLRFLKPYPDRFHILLVCTRWKAAASHPSLYKQSSDRTLDKIFLNLCRGDTVLLSSGIYTLSCTIKVDVPIRIIGMEGSKSTLELEEPLLWTACGGFINGVTLCRKSPSSGSPFVLIVYGGKLRVSGCDFNSQYNGGSCISIEHHGSLYLDDNHIYNSRASGIFLNQGDLVLYHNTIMKNGTCGVSIFEGNAVLRKNWIHSNRDFGIRLYESASVLIELNDLQNNGKGSIEVDRQTRKIRIRSNKMCKKQLEEERDRKLKLKQIKEEKEKLEKLEENHALLERQKMLLSVTPAISSAVTSSSLTSSSSQGMTLHMMMAMAARLPLDPANTKKKKQLCDKKKLQNSR